MNMVSMLITGDFVPHGRVLEMVKAQEFSHIFNDFEACLKSTDINITNLECPLVEVGQPINKIGPLLKAPVLCVDLLKRGHFGVATLANNHILDYGYEGLKSTIDCCNDAHIETVGAGLCNEEIKKPLIICKKDKKIGVINVAESEFSIDSILEIGANPIDFQDIFNKIQELKNQVDVIVVIAHGGHEFYKYPSPAVVKKYRMFIDFGANAVVGHHPHCYSGYEVYRGGLIFYSLGNFIFDWPEINKPGWCDGYAVKLLIKEKNLDFEIIPYKQGTNGNPGLRLLGKEERYAFDKSIEEINRIIASERLLQDKWQEYIEEVKDKYLTLIQPTSRLIKALQARNCFPKIFFRSMRNKLTLLNLIRCQSHREIMVDILNDKRGFYE